MVLTDRDVTASTNLLAANDNVEMNEWRSCFFKKAIRVINPSDARLELINQRNDPVQFYSFAIGSVEGVQKRLEVYKSI